MLPQAAAAATATTAVSTQHERELAPPQEPSPAPSLDVEHGDEDDDALDVPECVPRFTRIYQPVCASNGRVYANPSVFQHQQCRREALGKPALTQRDMAFCNERSEL